MTVGGLHGVPVCPVALGHVRKGSKLTDMAADIGLIRAAFQQTAGDRRYLARVMECSGLKVPSS